MLNSHTIQELLEPFPRLSFTSQTEKTVYWLDSITGSGMMSEEKISELHKEAKKLIAILLTVSN